MGSLTCTHIGMCAVHEVGGVGGGGGVLGTNKSATAQELTGRGRTIVPGSSTYLAGDSRD